MEYRVYTYSPGKTHTTPYRSRKHARRRSGLVIVLFTVLISLSLFVLFTLFIKPVMNLDQETPDGSLEADTHLIAVPSADPVESDPAVQPIPERTVPDDASGAMYDFSAPVPVSDPVENSYFDDAVFIGDSRTEGLLLNTGLANTTSYAYKGLMVDTAFTNLVINKDGQKVSVMDALSSTAFSKVYIMLGINETGWIYSQVFQTKYGEIIDRIREINPEAMIYIQEIMPVSNKVSSTHSYITNAKIQEYNGLLRELAEEKQVFYLDTGSAVAATDGSLPEDAAVDGIHLVKEYCEKWLDYLKTHTAAQ